MDAEDDSEAIDLNQVLILSKYITDRDSVRDAIECSGREVQEALDKVFSLKCLNDQVTTNRYSDVNLYDSNTYFVIVLAAYAKGTKREYISKILGEKGEQTLASLLLRNVIVEEGGRVRLAKGQDFNLDSEVVKQRIPDYLRLHSFARSRKGQNFIHVYSEGLTRQAISRIYELHVRLNRQIQRVLASRECKGDIPFFSFACMDQMLETQD